MHHLLTAFLILIAACGSESSEPPLAQQPVASETTPVLPATTVEAAPEPEPAPSYTPEPGSIRVVAVGEAPLLASQTEACEDFAQRLGEGVTCQMASDEEAAAIQTLLRDQDTERPSSWLTSETVVSLFFRAPFNDTIAVGLRGIVLMHGESMRPRLRYRADLMNRNRRNVYSLSRQSEYLARLIGLVRNGSEG